MLSNLVLWLLEGLAVIATCAITPWWFRSRTFLPQAVTTPSLRYGEVTSETPYPVPEPLTPCAICEQSVTDDEVHTVDDHTVHRSCWIPPISHERSVAIERYVSELHSHPTDDLMTQAITSAQDLDDEVEALCWRILAEPENHETRARLHEIAHGNSDLTGDNQLIVLAACSTEPVRRALLLGELAYTTMSDRTMHPEVA